MINLLIIDNTCHISGDFPVDIVKGCLTYKVPGYAFTAIFKAGHWDGTKSLYNKKQNSFPAGLVNTVVKELKDNNYTKISIEDKREERVPAFANNSNELLGIEFGKGKYSYQQKAVDAFIKAKRGILKIATNGGKTACAAAIIKRLAVNTLFLVTSVSLVKQTREVFSQRLGIPLSDIGMIGDSELFLGNWITVGTPDTLINRLEDKEIAKYISKIDLVIADEVHTSGAETFYEVMDSIPAYARLGMSGTPLNRSDGANLKIIAQTGEVIYEVPNKLLVDLEVSAKPIIEFVKINKPDLTKLKNLNWHSVDRIAVVENKELNNKIIDKVKQFRSNGLYPVLLVDKLDHGDYLEKELKKKKLKVKFAFGDLELDERQQILDDYTNRKYDCIIGSRILDVGIDCPGIDAIIFCSGGQSVIMTLQRIGRGMRIRPDKDKVYIVDFANFCHKWLTKHSLERIKTYKNEDCFKILVVDD